MTVATGSSTVLALGGLAGGVGVLRFSTVTFSNIAKVDITLFGMKAVARCNHATVELVADLHIATSTEIIERFPRSVVNCPQLVPERLRAIAVVCSVVVVVVVP